MEPAKTCRDVIAWQKCHEYILKVYRFTKGFPKDELFGLSSQFRRAAVSAAANIAEGFKRRTNKDKIRQYNIAQASLEECWYYEILSKDLEYGDTSVLTAILEEASRLLDAYIKKIK